MVYNPEGQPGEGEETVLCNPVLVESSVEEDLFEEGCLSFPEIYADVKVRASSLIPPPPAPEDFTTNQIYANPRRARTPAETERNEGCSAQGRAGGPHTCALTPLGSGRCRWRWSTRT